MSRFLSVKSSPRSDIAFVTYAVPMMSIDYFRNQNVDDLDEDENRLQIHIYGHSLDLTDKDILLPF